MTTNERLGAVVRARRVARGLTLSALAESSGIDVSQFSRIERGLCGLTPEQIERVAEKLHTSAAALWRSASPRRPAA